jgi:hypothetical protein
MSGIFLFTKYQGEAMFDQVCDPVRSRKIKYSLENLYFSTIPSDSFLGNSSEQKLKFIHGK